MFIGVDDWSSECDLDSISNWDYLFRNNNDNQLNRDLEILISDLTKMSEIVN